MKVVCIKCAKKIASQVNFGTDEKPLCYDCTHPDSNQPNEKRQIQTNFKANRKKSSIASLVILGCIIVFLGFFHIVTDNITIIPKEHFTFSMTFVSVSDIVSEFNSQSFAERMKTDVLFDHLVKQLEIKKMIVPAGSENQSEQK